MGAENVGILMAEERGYFGDLGLHVWVITPASPEDTASYVAAGADDIGVTQEPMVVLTSAIGEPIVAIGSVIPGPTAAMMWLPGSGIADVADLEGKTIATPGSPFQPEILEQVLARAGLTPEDVEIVEGAYRLVPTLLNGDVDAIFGGTSNLEGAALEARGAKPVITPVRELGVPAYEELVVIARPRCVAKHPEMYRHFMTAVSRGTAAAERDPRGAVRVIEESLEKDPKATRKDIEAQVEASLPLFSENGHMELGKASDLVAWMHDAGMIERELPVRSLFTNDFLAR
jgi:putative hydroxymethylpyrimidine transport system substrate-binding protein